ncbi:MAG: DNA adenine methylase [Deferribacteraceae bacterium]|jgi:DNA adenine methylase|nr:DNA adenine methylase [Deferribacteraceae bacterium]
MAYSLIPWIGGKRLLAKTIIAQIPPHNCYVEVFAGGASVFFRKEPSKVEILNDINKELITFYRVVQNHFEEFRRCVEFTLKSRAEFERFRDTPAEVLTDIQRAVRFFYIQKNCFGGRSNKATFGTNKVEKSRYNSVAMLETLRLGYERLRHVIIECLPYDKLFPHYDSPNTFYYLDPPYYGVENYYGNGIFSKEDYGKLAEILAGVEGKFLLSINDTQPIREIFKGFKIMNVKTIYSVGKSNRSAPQSELLIKNF